VTYGPSRATSLVSRAVRAVWRIRHARSTVPSPLVYVGAAVVGLGLGAVADVVLGWPWWAVTLGVMFAVWTFFMTSIFWGAGRGWAAFAPRRGGEREWQRVADALRSPPFPMYGLPASWSGLRFIGGHGGGTDRLDVVCFAHGDPFGLHGPELRVEVRRDGVPLAELLEDLGRGLGSRPDLPPGMSVSEMPRWLQYREELDAKARPERSVIAVRMDGRDVPFDAAEVGDRWTAVAQIEGLVIQVTGRSFPIQDAELVRIEDAGPYIEGSRALRDGTMRDFEAGEGAA
jgi:hypothetical protein